MTELPRRIANLLERAGNLPPYGHDGPCLNSPGDDPRDYTEHDSCHLHIEAAERRETVMLAVVAELREELRRRVERDPPPGVYAVHVAEDGTEFRVPLEGDCFHPPGRPDYEAFSLEGLGFAEWLAEESRRG